MNADKIVLDRLMERIIGSALTVSNALGIPELELIAGATNLKGLLDRAFGLTVYSYRTKKDGSTFSVSETERIAVRLCKSERLPGLHVISGLLTPVAREPGRS